MIKKAVIRQELVELTGCYKEALILSQFIYWSFRIKDHDKFLVEEQQRDLNKEIELRNGWIYKKSEELAEETMLNLSPSNIRKYIKGLVDNGWIEERRNPNYKWDKTLQYRVNTLKLKNDLYNLGYIVSFSDKYRISKIEIRDFKIETHISEIEARSKQNRTAIPENTTENIIDSTNQSVSLDIEKTIDGQTDLETEKETIIEKAEIPLYKGEHRELLETTVSTLLNLREIKVNNKLLHNKQIKEQLHKLTINICDFTFTKFRQIQNEKEIKNRARYFQVLLLSCIEEYSANSIY